jgi:hypothetical protein
MRKSRAYSLGSKINALLDKKNALLAIQLWTSTYTSA